MGKWKIKFKKFFKILGPGLVTGASDELSSAVALIYFQFA
jgi:hypothetical protein